MNEREITEEMPAPTQPTGPTEHLSDPEYWRGLYTDAIEVGKEMMADRADLRARITALEAEGDELRYRLDSVLPALRLAQTMRRVLRDRITALEAEIADLHDDLRDGGDEWLKACLSGTEDRVAALEAAAAEVVTECVMVPVKGEPERAYCGAHEFYAPCPVAALAKLLKP